MAHRIAPISTSSPLPSSPGTRGRIATLASTLVERQRARFRADPRLFLWRAGWSPIWLGSNGPAPVPSQRLRAIQPRPSAGGTGADAFIDAHLNGLASRLWLSLLAGSIIRGLWLGLLVVTGWVLLALTGLAGLPPLIAIAVLVCVGLGAGVAYGMLHRIAPSAVAVMLDRTFGLHERLTTANDRRTTMSPDGAVVPRLQLADAANTLGEVITELPRSVYLPVREVIALLVVTMALLTGLFAYVPDRSLPAVSDAPVPRFVPASERLANPQVADNPLATTPEQPAPSASDLQQQAQAALQAREDLGVLGEALEDHPITKAASDAIGAGDYAAASDMIRTAASEAPNASQEARDALAEDLETAADRIASTNPELAESSQQAAEGLREGGPEAAQGLEGLADNVDQVAGVVAPEQAAARAPEQSMAEGQGDPGQAQPGPVGEAGQSGGESSQGADTSEGSSASSDPSRQEAGETGDPGEGVAAEPGVAQEPQEPGTGGNEPGEMSGAAGSNQAQSGAGGAPDPEAAAGAPGSDQTGQQPAGDGGGSRSDSSSDAEAQGLSGAPDDENAASQGSGAGTGQTDANDQPQGDQQAGDPAAPGEGEAVDPPPVGEVGNPSPGNGGGEGSVGAVGEGGGTNDLSLQGTSDEGVRTGGSSGSSSVGSGSGSGAASGSQVQQQVGVAGPDANRIPEGMQDVVQDYFTDPGSAP